MKTVSLPASHEFLLGGGEMGELIRTVDWGGTPVGPVEGWPQSLRTAVSIMLNTHFPMYIAWGKEFTQFYNDGYRPILGSTKHPAAMGRSTRVTFSEIWDIIGPMFNGVLEGKAVGFSDFMLPLDRHGFTEECYFIFSYSPIKQEDGSTGGVLVTVTETSDRVLGERRLKTLRELGDRTYRSKNIADTCVGILEVLSNHKHDIPFSLLYTFDADGSPILQGHSGMDLNKSTVSLTHAIELASDKPLFGVPVSEIFSSLTTEANPPWPEPVHLCCACILARPDQKKGHGLLILGISPRLRYDAQYHDFFKLLNDQIVTTLTNANAFEEERKRAEALAELDRAKTTFFSNISHEFRTPLTLMLGPLEELLHNENGLQPRQKEDVSTAHRNAIRLLRLVNVLLDFSKIESGKLDALFRPTEIKSFTEGIVSSFRSLIEKAGLTLDLHFGEISEHIYLDPGMWEKIVFNLLSNAYKYTLQGSIKIELTEEGNDVVLKVKDTGVGIPEQELPRVFERFHRIANSAGRSYEGTGIGLSLVAELVKIHEGKISVDSRVGEGTIFTVRIPKGYRHLPEEKVSQESNDLFVSGVVESFVKEAGMIPGHTVHGAESLDTSNEKDLSEARILVVDDNADMLKYLVRILERKYDVSTAANGVEALANVARITPDLVVSDIMMPLMDGVELLKQIKANPKTAGIPVMLLSARAGEETRVEGYDVGADDYMVKPFSARELLARIKSQLKISKTRKHLTTLLKKVFEQTPAAITIIRKENYQVEFANDLYLEIVDKPDLVGKPLFAALPELRDQGIRELLDRVLTTGEPYLGKEVEVQMNRRGKSEKTFFNFVYHPLRDEDGSISGLIVVCFEVTDLVRAKNRAERSEGELEQKIKDRTAELEEKNALLTAANQELEQFAYIASHDLQEPLRKIRTFTSIIQRFLPDDPQSTPYFEKIQIASERMGNLIKDVLNYSRLSGRQSATFHDVDLNRLMESVMIDFDLMVEEHHATVLCSNLPTVQGVELQLNQLFANLLSNALKFSSEKPEINVSSAKISREQMAKFNPRAEYESYFEIAFRDNGIGFDPAYTDKIFEIFQRLHDKEVTGTGIGLALCKKIVENHHGFIRAESAPGNGTTFYVYLPALNETSISPFAQ